MKYAFRPSHYCLFFAGPGMNHYVDVQIFDFHIQIFILKSLCEFNMSLYYTPANKV